MSIDGRKYSIATWTARRPPSTSPATIVDAVDFTPNSTDDDQIAVPSGFGGGGFGPSDDHTNGGGLPGALNVVKGEALTGGTGDGLTSTQEAKLDAITLNASNEISAFTTDATRGDLLTTDQVDDSTSTSNKFATRPSRTSRTTRDD